MQMILTRRITKQEFETIKKVIELSKPGFVEPESTEPCGKPLPEPPKIK